MLDETGIGPVIIEWEGAGVVYPVGLENRLRSCRASEVDGGVH